MSTYFELHRRRPCGPYGWSQRLWRAAACSALIAAGCGIFIDREHYGASTLEAQRSAAEGGAEIPTAQAYNRQETARLANARWLFVDSSRDFLAQAQQANAQPLLELLAEHGAEGPAAWLTGCPAALGHQLWTQAWDFASQDYDLELPEQDAAGLENILRALCPGGFADLETAEAGALVARLGTAQAEQAPTSERQLSRMLSRLLAHAAPFDRATLADALRGQTSLGAAEDLWAALGAWRDGLPAEHLPPPANLRLRLVQSVAQDEVGSARLLLDHLQDLRDSRASASKQQRWESHRGAQISPQTEGRQSVVDFEVFAQASAERLRQRLGRSPSELAGAFPNALQQVRQLAAQAARGERQDIARALASAHPQLDAQEVFGLLHAVLDKLARDAPLPLSSRCKKPLLGPPALSLVWAAMAGYAETPEGRAAANAEKDRAMMEASLLRGLAESVSCAVSPPSGDPASFSLDCGAGIGTRIVRTLQGYYAGIWVDGEAIPSPNMLMLALGSEFSLAHPAPTHEEAEAFRQDGRARGAAVYAAYAAARRAFERLLASQVDGMQEPI